MTFHLLPLQAARRVVLIRVRAHRNNVLAGAVVDLRTGVEVRGGGVGAARDLLPRGLYRLMQLAQLGHLVVVRDLCRGMQF